MKKLYSILSVAFAGLILAPAASAITNVDQLYGNYNAVYTWGISDNNGNPSGAPNFLINPTISAGSQVNEINISGLFPTNGNDFDLNASTPIKATVNVLANTVTIEANQMLGTDKYGNNFLAIQVYDLNTGKFSNAPSVTGTINEYGDICFPTEYTIGCLSSDGGYWYMFFTLTLQPYSGAYLHEPDYYNGTYTTTFDWYKGDSFAQTTNVAVKPVLAAGKEPYSVNISNLWAYLYNGITVEAEVLPSGCLKIDNVQLWDYRNNGYQLIIFDKDFNMPDYVIAYLDNQGSLSFPEGTTVACGIYPNLSELVALYGYTNLVMSNEAGIDGIEIDDDAPVKYFNLSGMEIANPVKGQVVIKKKGNKSYKMIVK